MAGVAGAPNADGAGAGVPKKLEVPVEAVGVVFPNRLEVDVVDPKMPPVGAGAGVPKRLVPVLGAGAGVPKAPLPKAGAGLVAGAAPKIPPAGAGAAVPPAGAGAPPNV